MIIFFLKVSGIDLSELVKRGCAKVNDTAPL